MTMSGNPLADRADQAVATAKRKCSHCKGLIVWARAKPRHDAQRMPVDAEPHDNGNVLLHHHDVWGVLYSVMGARPARRGYQAAGWHFYQHHRLSCPQAHLWVNLPGLGDPDQVHRPRTKRLSRGRA